MSDHVVPHFHNDAGVAVIEIGSQEFMCVGANPPFDHPHVFLDLGNDSIEHQGSVTVRSAGQEADALVRANPMPRRPVFT